MEIGDWVITVGSPFALESTVSAGIISGKGRTLPSEKRPVGTVAEFQAALKRESLEDGILLVVRTRGGDRFVVLQRS